MIESKIKALFKPDGRVNNAIDDKLELKEKKNKLMTNLGNKLME